MAFIVGAVIGAGASIVGSAIASKGAKSAAKTAAAGQDKSVEFQRESRDMARADQAPYREAGYKALDALMDMTGLSTRGAPATSGGQNPRAMQRNAIYDNFGNVTDFGPAPRRGGRGSSWEIQPRAHGGAINRGMRYNINEVGPENVYVDGNVMRHGNPVTIDGKTGYVEPNTEGRYMGGPMFGGTIGPMVRRVTEGRDAPVNQAVTNQPVANQPTQATPRDAMGAPIENPGGVEGGYSFKTDPGYNFRFEEGQRALERGAAARGGLLSGGLARQAIRYGQNYASGEYTNVYNRIANIAGLGQVANNASGNYAMMAGQGMGQAAANSGYALASGQAASSNAWANGMNQVAQLPWGEIFNRPSASKTSQNGYTDSDRRLKKNIRRIGTIKGYPLYSFDYIYGGSGYGVMSDEVPQEFVINVDGFDKVHYGNLLGS